MEVSQSEQARAEAAAGGPVLMVGHVDRAPHLRDVGINPLSVRNQSHISLDEATWRRIVGALARAAAIGEETYVAAYA